jgi:hypothetical protein
MNPNIGYNSFTVQQESVPKWPSPQLWLSNRNSLPQARPRSNSLSSDAPLWLCQPPLGSNPTPMFIQPPLGSSPIPMFIQHAPSSISNPVSLPSPFSLDGEGLGREQVDSSQLLKPTLPYIYTGQSSQLQKESLGVNMFSSSTLLSLGENETLSSTTFTNPSPDCTNFVTATQNNHSKQAELLTTLQQHVIPELCRVVREISREFYNDKTNSRGSLTWTALSPPSPPSTFSSSSSSQSMSPLVDSLTSTTLNGSALPTRTTVPVLISKQAVVASLGSNTATSTKLGAGVASVSVGLGPISFSASLTELSIRVKCYSSCGSFYRRKADLLSLVGGRLKVHAQNAIPGKPAVIKITPIPSELGAMPWEEPLETMLFRFLRAALPLLEEMGLDNGGGGGGGGAIGGE